MKRIVDWKEATLVTPEKGKRLITFIYDNKDPAHPKIIHGDKVKVFSMEEIPSRKYTHHKGHETLRRETSGL